MKMKYTEHERLAHFSVGTAIEVDWYIKHANDSNDTCCELMSVAHIRSRLIESNIVSSSTIHRYLGEVWKILAINVYFSTKDL